LAQCRGGWPHPLPRRRCAPVGKSVLARRLLETEGIPWLPTDVVRTVLRRVLPELDAADQDPVDAVQLAEFMYPISTPGAWRPRSRGQAFGPASSATAPFPPMTSPPTVDRNRNMRARHRPQSSPRPRPGFATEVISCAKSAAALSATAHFCSMLSAERRSPQPRPPGKRPGGRGVPSEAMSSRAADRPTWATVCWRCP
jgi:hypothetical protein